MEQPKSRVRIGIFKLSGVAATSFARFLGVGASLALVVPASVIAYVIWLNPTLVFDKVIALYQSSVILEFKNPISNAEEVRARVKAIVGDDVIVDFLDNKLVLPPGVHIVGKELKSKSLLTSLSVLFESDSLPVSPVQQSLWIAAMKVCAENHAAWIIVPPLLFWAVQSDKNSASLAQRVLFSLWKTLGPDLKILISRTALISKCAVSSKDIFPWPKEQAWGERIGAQEFESKFEDDDIVAESEEQLPVLNKRL